jgi:hypothetical protein
MAGYSHGAYMVSFGFFPPFSEKLFFTLPRHCTRHLQYLHVAVMEPFQTKCAVEQNDWMMANPEKYR